MSFISNQFSQRLTILSKILQQHLINIK